MTAKFFRILPWVALGVAWAVRGADLPPGGPVSGLPSYLCERIDRDLLLSGRVDDPLWQKAQVAQLAGAWDGQPARFRTTLRMLYNARWLYLAFECEDDFAWGTLTNRDSAIYGEECVEAFISPSGKPRQYYEINVSPRNTVFDAFILNGRRLDGGRTHFRSWTDFTCDELETRAQVKGELNAHGAKGWSVEYAIPFTSIIGSDNLTPKPGEEWRANFYRIDAPDPKNPEYYAWSPTVLHDFHVPWRFGVLKFR